MSVRVLVAATLTAASTVTAFADGPPSTASIAETPVEPVYAFEQTPNFDGLFQTTNNGILRHVHSGLACDTRNERVTLVGITILDELGREVACDYEIPNTSTQISIFVTQHNGEDIQGEIDRTAALLRQKVSAKLAAGPRIIAAEADGLTPIAAKLNYVAPLGNQMSTSIWVNAINGWVVKVRATYSTEEEPLREAEFAAAFMWISGAIGVWSYQTN